ncbi:acrylyl-CoA reductase (NADPH) [Cupriavidus basilensis]|uniref:acrylyl-CoA reductase (NADPH) n=1 Tax=Cupriavidus basilensis TaxID=68895 RepID=UPI00157A74B2|nr:MDR family oxidoreductase [Cupriavidus basilensis]NUA30618.1 oxidoreductase [Cupriavidus basilensis]
MFRAILLNQNEGKTEASVQTLTADKLPAGDVTVAIDYSTLNYKDGMAITGLRPVVRTWPMVPGIDFAGTVEQSADPRYPVGSKVVLTGWGVGESYWGGLSQKAAVNGSFLVPLPEGLSTRDAMAVGTGGFTAMLCVLALERNGVTPDSGEILVTGANGGVGSFATFLLAKRGYTVAASTGRPTEADRLRVLGASEIIDRKTLSEPGKPLQGERWAGAVDSVGSHTLANVCASTKYGGTVAACGLAQGMDFPSTVAPFILRGVTLAGVDSVHCPLSARIEAWRQLSETLGGSELLTAVKEISLEQAIPVAKELLEGKVLGRVVVNVNK